jgi:hypothetical protein
MVQSGWSLGTLREHRESRLVLSSLHAQGLPANSVVIDHRASELNR